MKLSHFKRRTKLQVSGTYLDLHWLNGEGELGMMRTVAVCVNLYGQDELTQQNCFAFS